jgi:hypothetical protein
MKQTYRVTRDDIEWIAGQRVAPDGTIDLTEAQAEADLARGNIELVKPVASSKAKASD